MGAAKSQRDPRSRPGPSQLLDFLWNPIPLLLSVTSPGSMETPAHPSLLIPHLQGILDPRKNPGMGSRREFPDPNPILFIETIKISFQDFPGNAGTGRLGSSGFPLIPIPDPGKSYRGISELIPLQHHPKRPQIPRSNPKIILTNIVWERLGLSGFPLIPFPFLTPANPSNGFGI